MSQETSTNTTHTEVPLVDGRFDDHRAATVAAELLKANNWESTTQESPDDELAYPVSPDITNTPKPEHLDEFAKPLEGVYAENPDYFYKLTPAEFKNIAKQVIALDDKILSYKDYVDRECEMSRALKRDVIRINHSVVLEPEHNIVGERHEDIRQVLERFFRRATYSLPHKSKEQEELTNLLVTVALQVRDADFANRTPNERQKAITAYIEKYLEEQLVHLRADEEKRRQLVHPEENTHHLFTPEQTSDNSGDIPTTNS
jgi:hypothetical protein